MTDDYLLDSQIDTILAEAVIGAKQGLRPWQIVKKLAEEVKRLRAKTKELEAEIHDTALDAFGRGVDHERDNNLTRR